jgi:TolB protein
MWLVPRDDAGRAAQLTYGAGGYRGNVAWTTDGRIVFDSELGNATTISVMNADGSNARVLSGDAASQSVVYYARPSFDGRYIFYASDIKGKRNIWRMNLDGSNPVQLTDGYGEDHPCPTPDGKWVIYTQNSADRQTLWRVPVDGGEAVQVTDAFTSFADVSPDGKMIACLYSEGADWQIALLPFAGGKPAKVFPNRVEGSTLLQWLPDGKAISYAENLAGVSKVWIQKAAGGAPQEFIKFDNDRIFGFAWSADGKQLACVRGFWSANAVLLKRGD